MQEFEWLSYGRGKSVNYNEAKLRKQKWNVANKVVKKAMRQRRAAVQSRDSEACGDITQTLVRMMPGQGMLPDGFAGEASFEILPMFERCVCRVCCMALGGSTITVLCI